MTARWFRLWMTMTAFAVALPSGGRWALAQDADDPAAPPKAVDPRNVLEENPLLKEPRTPETLLDAVVLMTDLGRPNLAAMYLQKLMESTADDAALLRMRDKHGPAVFLRLSNDQRLQPDSITLLDQVNAAFRKSAMDPSRIDKLIADLNKSAETREVAILQLRNAGAFAAARVISVLNTVKDDAQRKLLLYTLTRFNREVVPVLLGAIDTPNPDLNSIVIEALGWLGDRQAVVELWHPAFESNQPAGMKLAARQALARLLFGTTNRMADVSDFGAVAALARSAREHLRGDIDWPLNDDGAVETWAWDDAAGTVAMIPVTARTASAQLAIRQARQAFELAPDKAELHALYWVTRMAGELHVAGRGGAASMQPGSNFHLGLQLGPDSMQQALVEALNLELPSVGVTALHVLAQTGSARLLKAVNGRPAPVVAALNYPDERVQFAAAATSLTWDPTTSFRGASRVVEVLSRSLSDSGTARGIVIDPSNTRASNASAVLQQLGFEPEIALTGQEGFQIATSRGDVSLFLIEANVARWDLSQSLANLRADARTAYIPIVVYGDEKIRDRIERQIAAYPRVRFAQYSSLTDAMHRQIAPFVTQWQSEATTQPQRDAIRRGSLAWLTQLADRKQASMFDLRPVEPILLTVINDDEELADSALFVLGAIPTTSAQVKLAEVVIAASRPAAIRERALGQLTAHRQRHSLLLTELQVDELRQAARKETDPALQSSFAAALGALNPDLRQASQLLKSAPSQSARPAPNGGE